MKINKRNHKLIILTIITAILFIVVFNLITIVFGGMLSQKKFINSVMAFSSKNEKTIFQIKDITFFSSCDVQNKNATKNSFTIENLYQYTDMALFLSSPSEEKTLENTLKAVSIDNIQYLQPPELGTPSLYYKNVNNFSKGEINDANKINDKLDFSISSEDSADFDKPVLYNNLANPITLSFINQNIKSDYTLTNTSNPITYDGSLLKSCGILLSSIKTKLSFDIYITNNLNQEFKSTVYIDIPLDSESNSIYDGSIKLKKNTNYLFYRYK